MVLRPSTIEECDSPIMSEDTIGSSVYAMMPFILLFDEPFNTLFPSLLEETLLILNPNTVNFIP